MMNIRVAEPADASAVVALLASAGQNLDDEQLDLKLPFPTLIASVDQVIVGVLEGRHQTEYHDRLGIRGHPWPQSWIYRIGVDPADRRLGVGRALVAEFARAAASEGSTFIAMLVDRDGDVESRLAFFASCGFRPLLPDSPQDAVGATVADVLACTSRSFPSGQAG
ncbi:GNAT family N-acetyltransferase [Saccharopolyspora sp. 6V]|uniref:GNAT family N-acetyltransferase n=1 Tax=Saccharopolyspora sp. 6V TaxID=2877239 RepID=UPI001CD2BA68|nr:GNAT family N-acetyltransferase [Saccharopolyspora sp. 6V]MCA1191631.1 GNAT family N-acetyltransferase [Saccharopolyspora sp. 6V]